MFDMTSGPGDAGHGSFGSSDDWNGYRHGRGRLRGDDFGLTARPCLLGLACTYLETQAQLWPELAGTSAVPTITDAVVEAMADDFERRFRTQLFDVFDPAGLRWVWTDIGLGYVRFSDEGSNPRSLDQQLINVLQRARRDRDTGHVDVVQKDREEWMTRESPETRILSDELADAVKAKLNLGSMRFGKNAAELRRDGKDPGRRVDVYPTVLVRPVCGGCGKPMALSRSTGKYKSFVCLNSIHGGRSAPGDCCGSCDKPPSHDTSRIAWAKLMARVGEEFPLECPGCGGEIRLIAFITDPGPIRGRSWRISANRSNHRPSSCLTSTSTASDGIPCHSADRRREERFQDRSAPTGKIWP